VCRGEVRDGCFCFQLNDSLARGETSFSADLDKRIACCEDHVLCNAVILSRVAKWSSTLTTPEHAANIRLNVQSHYTARKPQPMDQYKKARRNISRTFINSRESYKKVQRNISRTFIKFRESWNGVVNV